VPLSGAFTINGATPTSTDYGSVSLATADGDRVRLGYTNDGTYSTHAMPGIYDAYYGSGTPSDVTPRNVDAKLRTGIVIPAAGAVVNIDVPAVTVSGTFKINGSTVTDSGDHGILWLREASGQDLSIGSTSDGSYTIRLVPGTYDLIYQTITLAGVTPKNVGVKLRSGIVLTTSTTLDVDIPSVPVMGAFTIDGVPVLAPSDVGTLYLQGPSGDRVRLGLSNAPTYATRAIPATYDIFFDGMYAGPLTPANSSVRLSGGAVIAGATTLDIDVRTMGLAGGFQLNGAPVPGATDYGHLYLRAAGGDTINFGTTYSRSYALRAVGGAAYDLFYQTGDAGMSNTSGLMPRNQMARLRTQVILPQSGALALDVDIPSTGVKGAITMNGAPDYSPVDYGELSLRTSSGDKVVLGRSDLASYNVHVVPGTYDLVYAGTLPGSVAPRNQAAKLRCLVIE
jgi:hypothetical protein